MSKLIDLESVNYIYGINKRRIDGIVDRIIKNRQTFTTNTLLVKETTVDGVTKAGTLETDKITINDLATINGATSLNTLSVSGSTKVLSSITFSENVSVKGVTTLNSLEGAINIYKSKDSKGNLTPADVIVENNKTLSLSGSAITNNNTTLEGSLSVSGVLNGSIVPNELILSGSAIINSSTIKDCTIHNGTVNLNGNTLTVTQNSTLNMIKDGNNTVVEGVSSLTSQSVTCSKSSGLGLYIASNEGASLGNGNTPSIPTSHALLCKGSIMGARLCNSIWNDLADAIEVPSDTQLEYGYCYSYKDNKVRKTSRYADNGVLGIHSDTAGMILGRKNKKCIFLAVAGMVLAYVDKEYKSGTPLVATKGGRLTKASKLTQIFEPTKIIATYYKKETSQSWGAEDNPVLVNGRSWVRIL